VQGWAEWCVLSLSGTFAEELNFFREELNFAREQLNYPCTLGYPKPSLAEAASDVNTAINYIR
jgi:hypothetical protein